MTTATRQGPVSRFSLWKARLLPCILVFVAAFCLMVMELVAPRLVARHLGSSIYTWTSVIGVVLAGLGLGNYLGGRLADRFNAERLLPYLFLVSSALVFSTVWLNELISHATELSELAENGKSLPVVGSLLSVLAWFPMQVFLAILGVFFLPSVALGTISPVAAKMALEHSARVGATIGNIYAWGQIGAIAGTFAAGYVLIAQFGCLAVLTLTATTLAFAGLFLKTAGIVHAFWGGAMIAMSVMALAPESISWAAEAGRFARVRPEQEADVVYYDESEYYSIKVRERIETFPDSPLRVLVLDALIHGFIHPKNPVHLEYSYERVYASLMQRAGYLPADFRLMLGDTFDPDRLVTGKPIRCLFLGGGSYTFPRFLDTVLPGSELVVLEIDPAVTKAAREALFLEDRPNLEIIHGDARISVKHLLQEIRSGKRPPFDCIFGDAFNDLSVPHHLTTQEFLSQLRELLTPDGIYLMNIIDDYDHAGFLGAMLKTGQQTFDFVEAFSTSPVEPIAYRDTFVLLMSDRKIDLSGIPPATEGSSEDSRPEGMPEYYRLTSEQVEEAIRRAGSIILTDDYAPVENLLAPVVSDRD